MVHLILATRNAHKCAEIRAILGAGHHYSNLDDLPPAPAVLEDAPTFAGNATKKAVSLARWYSGLKILSAADAMRLFVLADDSGLEVDALHGAPGVHSARFAALEDAGTTNTGNSPDTANNARLLRLLKGVTAVQRTARFRCVLALTPVLRIEPEGASPVCAVDPDEFQTEIFEGTCEGTLLYEPRGRNGFGYDPLFVPTGFSQSFAELGEETKNRLSHRARALQKLAVRLAREKAH